MFKNYLKIFFLLIIQLTAFGQFNSNNLGISINAVYTTSADIFLNPNASDLELRNKSFVLEDIINPGIDIRYRFWQEVIVGLNIEYINKTQTAPNLTALVGNQVFTFNVEDGFKVIPIELTVHYYFPFSTESFKFMMGGGIGYYYGEFIRKFQGVELDIVQRKIAMGIHVSASMDYMIFNYLSARFEMKFRNPQYNVKSEYNRTEIIYQGNTIQLPEGAFETKVDIDGLTFVFGLVANI